MKGLTERQHEILDYIVSEKEMNGIFPSLSEIADHFSFSIPAAHYALASLEYKGYLKHEKGEHRAYLLSEKERSLRENSAIVLFPSEISEADWAKGSEERLFINIAEKPSDPFAFTIASLSMKNAGILPGDIAIMDKDISSLKDGDIVLARIGEEDKMELRRYRKTPYFIQLEPENDSLGIIKGSDIVIFAILKAIRRSYR